MIANVFLNRSKEYLIAKNFIDYHREIELINYIRRLGLIDDDNLIKAKIEFKKSHIGNK